MVTVFNVEWTPERVLKLVAFVFALGVLVQRIDSQAVLVQAQIKAQEEMSSIRFTEIQQRLSRVENKIDQRP